MNYKFIISLAIIVLSHHASCATDKDELLERRIEFMRMVETNSAHDVARWLRHGWNPNYKIDYRISADSDESNSISPIDFAVSLGHVCVIDTLLSMIGRRNWALITLNTVKIAVDKVELAIPGNEKRKAFSVLSRVLGACKKDPIPISKHRRRERFTRPCPFMDEVLCLYAKYGLPGFNESHVKALTESPTLQHRCLCHAAKNKRSLSIVSMLSGEFPDQISQEDKHGISPLKLASDHGNQSALDIFGSFNCPDGENSTQEGDASE